MVEVLSPGGDNERRDLVTKRALYSRRGVDEYWVLDWRQRRARIYRRQSGGGAEAPHEWLQPVAVLNQDSVLTSPLLPGFSCPVDALFPPPDWPVPTDED